MTAGNEIEWIHALNFPVVDSIEVVATELVASEDHQQELFRCLSADERARQERYLLPEIRRRFGICRSLLRHALGRLLGITASEVKIAYNALGKPSLAESHRSPLQFNVSHSEDWGLFAFSRSTPVGIDIEIPRPRTKFLDLAKQVLSPKEMVAIEHLSLAEQELQVKLAWVAKESLLKAMGVGIGTGMQSVQLSLPLPMISSPRTIDPMLLERIDDDGTCRANSWIDASAWRVHQLDVLPQGYAAVTCVARVTKINVLKI